MLMHFPRQRCGKLRDRGTRAYGGVRWELCRAQENGRMRASVLVDEGAVGRGG